MKRIVLLLCIIISCQKIIIAQQVSLKHPLSGADYISLDKVARNCFATVEFNISFEINLEDFYDPKYIKPDKPDSLKHIEELEKKIKGNYRDAKIYLDIGTIYKRLYMLEDARKNFSRALDLAKEYVKNNPDSASAYGILGLSFFSLDDFTEAGLAFEQSYNLNNNDSIALTVIPTCYTFAGNFNSALTTINNIIDKDPDNVDNYTYLLTTLYMQKFTEFMAPGPAHNELESSLKGKSAEEILDLSKIIAAYERNKNDIHFELLYRYYRHLSLFIKSFARTISQLSTISPNKFRFLLDKSDLIEFDKLESFYKTCLNDSRIPNKVMINEALGNIYLFKGRTKSALLYLKKAIELRSQAKSTFSYNAAEDYDNLAAAYLILKDTVSFEKVMQQKFNVRPAINPLPEDYISMAKISFSHKDYLSARKYSEEALKINPDHAEAYICLAVLDILNRDTKNAEERLNESYKIDPNNYALYVLQGVCLLYDNDISTAYAVFKFAKKLTLDPAWIDEDIINKYFTVETK